MNNPETMNVTLAPLKLVKSIKCGNDKFSFYQMDESETVPMGWADEFTMMHHFVNASGEKQSMGYCIPRAKAKAHWAKLLNGACGTCEGCVATDVVAKKAKQETL